MVASITARWCSFCSKFLLFCTHLRYSHLITFMMFVHKRMSNAACLYILCCSTLDNGAALENSTIDRCVMMQEFSSKCFFQCPFQFVWMSCSSIFSSYGPQPLCTGTISYFNDNEKPASVVWHSQELDPFCFIRPLFMAVMTSLFVSISWSSKSGRVRRYLQISGML